MAKILIVDDEKSIRHTLGEFLRADGHEVSEAAEAEAALERLQGGEYDVVLSDIIMPRISGVDLLRRIHATAPQVQVVMMTGEPTVETASESLRAGAADYLFKPITKAAILRTVTNAVRLKTLADEKRRFEAENRAHQENLERLVDERTRQWRDSEAQAQTLSRFNQAVLDSLTAHICVLSEDGTILAVNRAWQDFAVANPPLSAQAGVGDNYLAVCEAVTGEDAANVRETVRGLRAVLRGELPEFILEYPCHSPDEQRWFMLRATRFAGDGSVRMVVAHFNITGQKMLEEKLRQTAKMEAIGQLAGGVAHDFNNILAAVLIHLGMLRHNSQLTEETQESLKEIEIEVTRAAKLTRQLLLFSLRQSALFEPLDISAVVKNLLKMLRRLLGENIAIEFQTASAPIMVKADVSMLEQVVMNLAVNARDAMPNGGNLGVEITLTDRDERSAKTHPEARPGRFVCLEVTDTGCGMNTPVLKRIFEPFFTTKEMGKGTGLGLATVYGILKQHKGWIEVSSQVGKGSSFRVYLPAIEDATKTDSKPDHPEPMLHGSETILLVEDEAALRHSAALCLRKLGYAMLEAGSPEQALQIWDQHREHISLLFTDQVMPGPMTGWELAQRLRKEKLNLKVLMSSGYNNQPGQLMDEEGFTFLAKPYLAATLAKLVRRCLDESNSNTLNRMCGT